VEEIVTLAGLKEAGYFGLLIALLYAIWRSGKTVATWAFHPEHGAGTRLVNKAVETLNQVQASVAEQSAAAKEIAANVVREGQKTDVLIEKVDRIDRHLVHCPILHPIEPREKTEN
jgi:hypothetical protein